MPTQRQQIGRYGGLISWANTADRTARTAPGRRAGPGSNDYWLARLDPDKFADATDEQKLAAAEAAKAAYFSKLALKSARSRANRGTSDAQPA